MFSAHLRGLHPPSSLISIIRAQAAPDQPPRPTPPCRSPAATLLVAAAVLLCLGSAAAQGQHLPITETCCKDNAKAITQLQAQLRTLQSQFNAMQRSMQQLLDTKQQLVQARRGGRGGGGG